MSRRSLLNTRTSCLILPIFITVLFFASPAPAATSAKKAEELKTMFENILSEQKEQTAEGLRLDGDVLVEPDDNYYAITLPHISVVHDDNSRIDIGIISLNAIEGDQPGTWKMTMALPTPITYYDSDGIAQVVVRIGKQNFAGIWHEKFRNFTKLKSTYKNIDIQFPAEGTKATLAEFTTIYNLVQDDQGYWTGPVNFTASDIDINMSGGRDASIGKITYQGDIYDYDLDVALNYRSNINALGESYQSGEGSMSSTHATALYNLIAEFIGSVWDGFQSKVSAEDIRISRPAIPGSPAGEMKLDSAKFALGMRGFREDSVTLNLDFGYKGVKITPTPPSFNATVPDTVEFDVSVNKLPYSELIRVGRETVSGTAENPLMAKNVMMQTLLTVPALLTKAGTNLTLNNIVFQNDTYRALMNGTLTADLEALKGAIGHGKTEISGLNDLMTAIQQEIANPDNSPETQAKLQQLLQTLAILQLSGQKDVNAEGAAVHKYEFELTKDGKILLNGTDIQNITGSPAP